MRRFLVALSAVALTACVACSSSDSTPPVSDPTSASSSGAGAGDGGADGDASDRGFSENPTLAECQSIARGSAGDAGASASAPAAGDSAPAPAGDSAGASASGATPANGDRALAEECLRAIPAEQLAGALLATGVTSFEQAQEAVDLGVRHLFIGTGTDFSILNGQGDPDRSLAVLQERAGGSLVVSVDEEGGVVQRLSDLIGKLPSAQEMAATMSPQEVKDMMREHGRKMRDLGITMDFAPDADLAGAATVEENAIGSRAFGDNPQVVADYARAYAEGLQESGIEPVFKHFPGHGHTTGDSHMGTVTAPERAELEANDMVPFAQVAGMEGISMMVGHMQTPGLDGVRPAANSSTGASSAGSTGSTGSATAANSERGANGTNPGANAAEGGEPVLGANTPASLNPGVYALLREGGYSVGAGGVGHEEGGGEGAPAFTGPIFTDDLTGMKAVTDLHPGPDAAVAALEAGADQALTAAGAIAVPDLVEAVRAAIVDGRISEEHVYAAVARAHL